MGEDDVVSAQATSAENILLKQCATPIVATQPLGGKLLGLGQRPQANTHVQARLLGHRRHAV
ncbi:MAG: hypothetical protein E5V37_02165 [Mesorhizobium sp.]|nr:MAG: hypothetical protein E5V57_03940 [Mesorhizobium sp.]TIX33800.1 MAG: hypothetical protein E5V37_02165 [Mesorhizobium sp.]